MLIQRRNTPSFQLCPNITVKHAFAVGLFRTVFSMISPYRAARIPTSINRCDFRRHRIGLQQLPFYHLVEIQSTGRTREILLNFRTLPARATTITQYIIDHGAASCIAAYDSRSELEHWESNQMYYFPKVHTSKFHKESRYTLSSVIYLSCELCRINTIPESVTTSSLPSPIE